MTGIERMGRILERKKADRIGLYEHFWNDTQKSWTERGWLKPDERLDDAFPFDMGEHWAFNGVADMDFEPRVIAETAETVTVLDGNGAILRRHKLHDATPEHVDFTVKDRRGWEEKIKPLLAPEERRIDFEGYRREKERCRKANRFFALSGVNVFEMIHPVCGHVNMLMGMVDDPEWITDMCDTYANLQICLQEILFAREGAPDGIWYYEDMGYKGSPFMSPRMYAELIQPYHKRTIDFAHARGMKVIMHSCGYVEPLIPKMIEAGVDMLQVIEVKAGMDLKRIYSDYGDRLSLMGGIDVRKLYTNDTRVIDTELMDKIPYVKRGYGYALHSDHSIPNTVNIDTYRHFIARGLELGAY